MRVMLTALVFLALPFAPYPARADPYRWCAIYRSGGSESCYFATLEQCRASVSGRGGFCRLNYYNDGRSAQVPGAGSRGPRRQP
ncbi:MAG: DUF3551 domain-containing protein [Xanthobacteraceae bacterium]|nr:DUF3551 domain-containing protein [Xanthobacteraceae bacterium]